MFHIPTNHGSLLDGLLKGASGLGAKAEAFAPRTRYARGHGGPRLHALVRARRADLVVCAYGSSLYDPPLRSHFLLDLPLYRRSVVIFQGSDARQHYPMEVADSRLASGGDALPALTPWGVIGTDEVVRKQAKIAKAARHSERLIAVNPDLLAHLPDTARYMPYPYSGADFPEPELRRGEGLRVLHLATNPILKGTPLIREAIEGRGVELRVLEKVDKASADAALGACDVLIDQVGLGWYGYQAIEALARGVPVVCRLDPKEWQRHVGRPPEACGFIAAGVEELGDAVERLRDPELRREIGRAGQKFVADVHDPVTVVRNAYGDLIDG